MTGEHGTEGDEQVVRHSMYVWELNPGHFEWEVWREIDQPGAHKPGCGNAPTYLGAYDAAAACMRQELIAQQEPKSTVTRSETKRRQKAML